MREYTYIFASVVMAMCAPLSGAYAAKYTAPPAYQTPGVASNAYMSYKYNAATGELTWFRTDTDADSIKINGECIPLTHTKEITVQSPPQIEFEVFDELNCEGNPANAVLTDGFLNCSGDPCAQPAAPTAGTTTAAGEECDCDDDTFLRQDEFDSPDVPPAGPGTIVGGDTDADGDTGAEEPGAAQGVTPSTAGEGGEIIVPVASGQGANAWQSFDGGVVLHGEELEHCERGEKTPTITLNVEIPVAGIYRLDLSGKKDCKGGCASDANNDVCLEVPSDKGGLMTSPKKYYFHGGDDVGGGWELRPANQKSMEDGGHVYPQVELDAGTHTVIIHKRSAGFGIKDLYIRPFSGGGKKGRAFNTGPAAVKEKPSTKEQPFKAAALVFARAALEEEPAATGVTFPTAEVTDTTGAATGTAQATGFTADGEPCVCGDEDALRGTPGGGGTTAGTTGTTAGGTTAGTTGTTAGTTTAGTDGCATAPATGALALRGEKQKPPFSYDAFNSPDTDAPIFSAEQLRPFAAGGLAFRTGALNAGCVIQDAPAAVAAATPSVQGDGVSTETAPQIPDSVPSSSTIAAPVRTATTEETVDEPEGEDVTMSATGDVEPVDSPDVTAGTDGDTDAEPAAAAAYRSCPVADIAPANYMNLQPDAANPAFLVSSENYIYKPVTVIATQGAQATATYMSDGGMTGDIQGLPAGGIGGAECTWETALSDPGAPGCITGASYIYRFVPEQGGVYTLTVGTASLTVEVNAGTDPSVLTEDGFFARGVLQADTGALAFRDETGAVVEYFAAPGLADTEGKFAAKLAFTLPEGADETSHCNINGEVADIAGLGFKAVAMALTPDMTAPGNILHLYNALDTMAAAGVAAAFTGPASPEAEIIAAGANGVIAGADDYSVTVPATADVTGVIAPAVQQLLADGTLKQLLLVDAAGDAPDIIDNIMPEYASELGLITTAISQAMLCFPVAPEQWSVAACGATCVRVTSAENAIDVKVDVASGQVMFGEEGVLDACQALATAF